MKPNFKSKYDPKVNVQPQNKANHQNHKQEQEQGLLNLGQSLVGQRQFVYFDKGKNQSNVQNSIEDNSSLVGTVQKVYFTNSSTVIKEQISKDKKIYDQINAFKPSDKLVREEPSNFKKVKSTVPTKNNQTQKVKEKQEQDENEFLQLNHVGKWNKSNKSTTISEQMKKMHTHLQNRLTQTKWPKPKPNQEQRAQTQKNPSSQKPCNKPQKFNPSTSKTEIPGIQIKGKQSLLIQPKQNTKTNPSQIFTRQTRRIMQGIRGQDLQRMSSMTCWKQGEREDEGEVQGKEEEGEERGEDDQEQEEEEDEDEEDDEDEEEEDEEEEDEEDEEEEQEKEQEEKDQQLQGQQDQAQSSGDQRSDEPEDQAPEDQQEEQKQNPLQLTESPQVTQIKAKKWQNTKPHQDNPSIHLQTTQQNHKQQNQIQDLTEGQIKNDQIDPDWEQIQKILLRIQKLVN